MTVIKQIGSPISGTLVLVRLRTSNSRYYLKLISQGLHHLMLGSMTRFMAGPKTVAVFPKSVELKKE
jgi:hypothetical protein